MTAKELINYLQCVEPETEIGLMYGDKKEPLKSMHASGDTLYLTTGNYSFRNSAQEVNMKCILVALAQFAKK